MDINDLKRVNNLWSDIYPYLVSQIMGHYRKDSGSVLELGPFAGGISREMVKLYPRLKITIADEFSDTVEYLRKEIIDSGLSKEVEVLKTPLNRLIFSDSQFELIIFRGVYFFLDQEGVLLREIFRVLKDQGMAFLGGGYGKDTPQMLIDEIGDESRELNNRLGRKRISGGGLDRIIRNSRLASRCKIEEEGGLWININK